MTIAIVILGALCAALLYVIVRLEDRWAKERNLLISRIQTPEIAPSLAIPTEDPEMLEAIELDDDKAYWENRGVVVGD